MQCACGMRPVRLTALTSCASPMQHSGVLAANKGTARRDLGPAADLAKDSVRSMRRGLHGVNVIAAAQRSAGLWAYGPTH